MNSEKDGCKSYFFDTYALIELIQGSKNYQKFKKGVNIIVIWLNLYELYFHFIRLEENEKAEFYFNRFRGCVIVPIEEDYKNSAKFRLTHLKKDISFIDSLGYVIAKRLNVKFLTGDNKFKDIKNVEFVK